MKNRKGFTLIEIIVSLMIASIGMIIATTIILNSMGYFNKTAIADHDKQALDSIKDYVTNELMYASEVKISDTYPSQKVDEDYGKWNWLFVKGNVLYRDVDMDPDKPSQKVHNDDFYGRRKLIMTVRGFDSHRIDFKFYFKDKVKETDKSEVSITNDNLVYKTTSTIELLNMKGNILASSASPFDKVGNTRNLSNEEELYHDRGFKVYYKKGDIPVTEGKPPELDYTGTVADQFACKTDKNDLGKFAPNTVYQPGNMVYLMLNDNNEVDEVNGKKVWFRCLHGNNVDNVDAILKNHNLWWKRIDAFHSQDSGYQVGDVVIANKTDDPPQYYRCIQKTSNQGIRIPVTDTAYWEKIDKPTEKNEKCDIEGSVDKTGTVADKDDNQTDIPEYEDATSYGKKIFVKYQGDIWYKLDGGSGNIKPGEKDNQNRYIWQKIQMVWDATSGYDVNDIIYYEGNFYKATKDMRDGRVPAEWKYNSSWEANDGWVKVAM